ncbi:LAME_0H02212g1_1 [Lachancea meyersii CBS 8951]|uniref:Autophagy-related protein 29 n=1 Tax=Lachancea meyersii CBS 8951 TaxID=1266667 RepID=A0A1G4KDD0_9SACH|nr:LAME_0H02212g1_1 [Lachancea meyersii CBS 8951]
MDADNTVVYIKVTGRNREGFVEPPKFYWDLEKDQKLWSKISHFGNKKKSIDWTKLSREFETPEYFLRKRSYRLFAKHLRILEREIETKTRGLVLEQDTGDNADQNDMGDSGSDVSDDEKQAERDSVAPEGVKNLRWSKILNQRVPGDPKATDSSLSELSNLSVSKSALEEALLERLQL